MGTRKTGQGRQAKHGRGPERFYVKGRRVRDQRT